MSLSDQALDNFWPRRWLLLGVASLVASGLPALALVIARTTGLADAAFLSEHFHEALVVHVDLSVLVWFLTMACMFWSMEAARCASFLRIPYHEGAAWGCMAAGAALLTVSPFFPGEAHMSNYIPVVANGVFFIGLALIWVSMLLQCAYLLLMRPRFDQADGLDYAQGLAVLTAVLITLMAAACFLWARKLMPLVIEGQQFYELTFWAGGHVLQFTHVQMLMLAWLMLAAVAIPGFTLPRRTLLLLFAVSLLAVMLAPVAFLRYDVTSMEFRQFFTDLMIYANGLAPVALVLLMAGAVIRAKRSVAKTYLICSIAVFAFGGVLGLMITGQNVIIPAHYHGSIVGTTIAFMGACVALFPRFGWRDMSETRLARWQPVILAVGQVMHVTGLAWLGGYGVARKTPGAEAASGASDAALHIMRFGGLLAVIGGILFIMLVVRALKRAR